MRYSPDYRYKFLSKDEMTADKLDELDAVGTTLTTSPEGRAAPMVPLVRGDIKARWLIEAAFTNDAAESPASWITATEPVYHMGRYRTELGGQATLEEHRRQHLGQMAVHGLVEQVAAQEDYPDMVALASANAGSYKGFIRNGFREAHQFEVPDEVTEYCRTDCRSYENAQKLGDMCCDTIVLLDTTWQQDEEGLYVPRHIELDPATSEA